ncbi:hypothetical protein ABZ816_35635 [Actinosynnema sp. NPDC047251]|uniref:Uncharacterized protein n=1 Tax=Saccharothrix espanaensis (strain ATCC 51144 / DSM 44229 / JCM 9112 / NBRC 15066 / NRRL 15764) TaxID=1179773 RepID=K0JPY7_SACES|nr:hypothetical protein [Saccharothrix espanaensis]CCH29305.1 hypothetical protein BN6_19840 [Saccharothrix espanaensis DSM 44229]
MFGAERQEALENRIAELERAVQTLTAHAGPARPKPADTARLEALTARAEAAAAVLHSRDSPVPLADGFEGRIDTLYRAEVTGFVAVYFVTGRTAKVQLLIGTTNPPTRVVGVVDSRGSHQSYAGGIVRAGEYWAAASASRRPNLDFRVHFTPLF